MRIGLGEEGRRRILMDGSAQLYETLTLTAARDAGTANASTTDCPSGWCGGASLQPSRFGGDPHLLPCCGTSLGWQFIVQASGLQKVRPQLPG